MILDIHAYNITLHVFIGGTAKEIITTFTSRKGDQGNFLRLSLEEKQAIRDGVKSDEGFVMALDLSTGHCLLFVQRLKNHPKDLGILVHEIGHTVFDSFNRIGATVGEETEEHFCHLLQYLTTELLNAHFTSKEGCGCLLSASQGETRE